MDPKQSSVTPQPEQKAASAVPASTEEQWEAAAIALLCAEIDRMDAVAASTAAVTEEDKFVLIDGSLYVKTCLVSEKDDSPEAGMRRQS